ncbi:hypothetical protein GCM10025771_06300 [Niveibacterium umoris]
MKLTPFPPGNRNMRLTCHKAAVSHRRTLRLVRDHAVGHKHAPLRVKDRRRRPIVQVFTPFGTT